MRLISETANSMDKRRFPWKLRKRLAWRKDVESFLRREVHYIRRYSYGKCTEGILEWRIVDAPRRGEEGVWGVPRIVGCRLLQDKKVMCGKKGRLNLKTSKLHSYHLG